LTGTAGRFPKRRFPTLHSSINSPIQNWRAISAGTHPAAQVHPVVIDVMREVGIDLKRQATEAH
jgi:protein-tyrosine-phosphatase